MCYEHQHWKAFVRLLGILRLRLFFLCRFVRPLWGHLCGPSKRCPSRIWAFEVSGSIPQIQGQNHFWDSPSDLAVHWLDWYAPNLNRLILGRQAIEMLSWPRPFFPTCTLFAKSPLRLYVHYGMNVLHSSCRPFSWGNAACLNQSMWHVWIIDMKIIFYTAYSFSNFSQATVSICGLSDVYIHRKGNSLPRTAGFSLTCIKQCTPSFAAWPGCLFEPFIVKECNAFVHTLICTCFAYLQWQRL